MADATRYRNIGGDAPDPYKGRRRRYATRKESQGARHLAVHREWLGPGASTASVSRETDGCDMSAAEQDGEPNLGPGCDTSHKDKKDTGVVVPEFVEPGKEIVVEIDVVAKIDAFGFTNRGPAGEDSAGVLTLKPDCTLGPIADVEDTPSQHRDCGRYAAWDPRRRLYLKGWADWNADGVWEDRERVISGPLDPEDWGADAAYTLGEPFTDSDGNGVWTPQEAVTSAVR